MASWVSAHPRRGHTHRAAELRTNPATAVRVRCPDTAGGRSVPTMTLHSSVTVPGPRRVVSVDLDAPLPRLVADESGSSALVVGYRDGFPVTTLDVLLTADPADAARASRPWWTASLGPPVRRRPPSPTSTSRSSRSSCRPSSPGSRTSGKLLDFLEHLDYPRYEVILVDNRVKLPEVDALPGLLEGRDVRLVTERRPGCPPAGTPGSPRRTARSSRSPTTTSGSTHSGSGPSARASSASPRSPRSPG